MTQARTTKDFGGPFAQLTVRERATAALGIPRPAALLRDATDPRGRGRQGGAAGALGHSTPTITLNEYVHEWPDALDRTRSLVDSALGGPETAATPAVSQA
jgi:hypothetical protein